MALETTKPLSPEEIKAQKQKMLAIAKASNQLLMESKRKLELKDESEIDPLKYTDVPVMTKGEKLEALDEMIDEHYKAMQNQYGATADEVNAATFKGPDEIEIQKYNKRMAMRKAEEIAQAKATVGVQTNTETEEKTTRRKRKSSKLEEDYGFKGEIKVDDIKPVNVKQETDKIEKTAVSVQDDYTFDINSIPDYVQYDVIPLPSNGECYPHKISRVPVAYLTAADENIIFSPNIYRDGKLIDVLLKRKILDKRVNVDELCSGDRDAIVLWLRATAYGVEFPLVATNPSTGKEYNSTVKLNEFKYNEFNLKGDENGWFEYSDGKNVFKYRYQTKADEIRLRDTIVSQMSNYGRANIYKNLLEIEESMERANFEGDDYSNFKEDLDEMLNITGNINDEDEDKYPKAVTEQMTMCTMSVNGNTDREYIKNFVENMRVGEAKKYRDYMNKNKPGVDLTVNVNIPESDGGGSFATFLRLNDTVFLTY